jgi:hypothetical protein
MVKAATDAIERQHFGTLHDGGFSKPRQAKKG